MADLNSRGVDIKLLEDGEGLFKELKADTDVSNVRSIVIVKTIDVLHHTSCVSLDGCQDEQVL